MPPTEPTATSSPLRPRRPVLAGNSQAGVDVLDLLLERWSADEVLVIAPAGGAKHRWQPSLADHARRCGVPVIEPAQVNNESVIEQVRSRGSDVLISAYYTQIFRPAFLDAVAGPAFNFHPSLLPRHRGTAPLIWAIVEGDDEAGVSLHEIAVGVDTGRLFGQERFAIGRDDTGYDLQLRANQAVRTLAADLIERLAAGVALPTPWEQSGPASLHTSRDGTLNDIVWSDPPERIRNIVRALAHPLPGTTTTWNGHVLGVERVDVATEGAGQPGRDPGTVTMAADRTRVFVQAGGGLLELVTVRWDGELCEAADLIAFGLADGDRLC